MEPDGLAAAWRPATRRFVVEGYGYWLAWLKRSGYLDPTSPPGDRITPCRLESYLSYLRSHLATATVENRLVSLDRGIYAMAPAADRTLLRRLIRHVHDPNAGVAQKRRRVVDSYDLFGLGIRMMVEAEDPRHDFMRPVLRPVRYRDGLIVSLLAARPLRRRNIAGLLLGEHVRRIDRRWWILVPAEETKNRSALELPFPDQSCRSSRAISRGASPGSAPPLRPHQRRLLPGGAFVDLVTDREGIIGPYDEPRRSASTRGWPSVVA